VRSNLYWADAVKKAARPVLAGEGAGGDADGCKSEDGRQRHRVFLATGRWPQGSSSTWVVGNPDQLR